jgi:peptide/nickel transport system permease protein
MIASNPEIRPEDIARLRELYGADRSVFSKYSSWLGSAVQGDFGYSRTYKIPVVELLKPRLFNTLILSGLAFTFAVFIGITFGIIAGLRPGSRFDYVVNFFAFAGVAMPSFFIAIVLILIFAVGLNWLPAGGTMSVGAASGNAGTFADRLPYLVLPVLALTVLQMASYARYSRSAMIEAMGHDFVRTARAKGLMERTVVLKHGFRNALIPIITVIALNTSGLLSGAVIAESVFAYQGVGKTILDAILQNDFNVAMVSFLITIAMVLFMNLVADLLYAVVDPRISYT